jgi:hypothetical protein
LTIGTYDREEGDTLYYTGGSDEAACSYYGGREGTVKMIFDSTITEAVVTTVEFSPCRYEMIIKTPNCEALTRDLKLERIDGNPMTSTEPTLKPTISVSVIKPVTKAPTAATTAGGGVFSKAGKSKTQTKTSKAGSSSSKSGKASKSTKIAGKQGKSNHNTVQSNIQHMKYDVLNGAGAVGMYAVNFVSAAAAVSAIWSFM